MGTATREQELLEDLAANTAVSHRLTTATVLDAVRGECQKQVNLFLVRRESFTSEGSTLRSDHVKAHAEATVPYPYNDATPGKHNHARVSETVPEGFQRYEFLAVQPEPTRVTCPDCEGSQWKPHGCVDSDRCPTCTEYGQIKCSCTDGTAYEWVEVRIEYEVVEGRVGVAGNDPYISNEKIGEANGEYIGEKTRVYELDNELPREVQTTLPADLDRKLIPDNIVKHRREIYTVPFAYLQLEHRGDEYEVTRINGNWNVPDDLLESAGSLQYRVPHSVAKSTQYLLKYGWILFILILFLDAIL